MPEKTIKGVLIKFESHYRVAARELEYTTETVKTAVEAVLESAIAQTREHGTTKVAGMLVLKQ